MSGKARRIRYSASAANPMPISSSELGPMGTDCVGAVTGAAVKLAVWLAPLMVTAWLAGV